MASPQIENGFTKIANELLEALCHLNLSGHEWQVIHAIMRKTYGYNKKHDWITNTQIMLVTGQSQQKVSLAKRKLVDKNIVTENGNKIGLNKDYETWQGVTDIGNRVTDIGNKLLPKTVNTKEKKETITKYNRREVKLSNMKKTQYTQLGTEIIKAFESVDPKNKTYYNNTSQREASDFLIEEYGLEEVKNRIAVLSKTNRMQYFPSITTPCQLRDKWVQLENAVQRAKHKEVTSKSKVAF